MLALLVAAGGNLLASEEIVLQTSSLRLGINGDGTLASLADGPGGSEYLYRPGEDSLARVYRGGQWVFPPGAADSLSDLPAYRGGQSFPATAVALTEGVLSVRFAEADVTARYRVTQKERYLALELLGLTGKTVDHIDLLRLPLRRLPRLGTWINVAHDQRYAVCLCAGNVCTDAGMEQRNDHVVLRSTADPHVAAAGAVAVLFGCREPQKQFLDYMETVERDLGMPPGAALRRLPAMKDSYLWASDITPQNADGFVEWARGAGLPIVLFSYTAFSRGAGHFSWNRRYPNGMADLKRVTETIRRAGLGVGMHIHYSKAHKSDPYVTPVPDNRLHKLRQFTLSADVDTAASVIPVRENPAGCTLDEGRRIFQVDKELIAYEAYTTEPPYQFSGCQRGHLNTTASAHRAGQGVGLLDVDTWTAFFRYDQNTDIQDETAIRLAEVIRQTGPYEMIYYDGAEDVHTPLWFHIANAQYRVWKQLQPTPPVAETASYTNFSWHMMTRGNAYDMIAPPAGMKDFCDLIPCPSAAARVNDFSRIEFGWLGRFGQNAAEYAGPDVLEYVVSRAAGWDCPISVAAALKGLQGNPRDEDCQQVLQIWENARRSGRLTESQRRELRNVEPDEGEFVNTHGAYRVWDAYARDRTATAGQRKILARRREHHLFLNEQGEYELVEIRAVSGLPDGALKAYWFRRASQPKETYVLVWAGRGSVKLRLPIPASRLAVMRPFGTLLSDTSIERDAGIVVDSRRYLCLRETTPAEADKLFRQAGIDAQ